MKLTVFPEIWSLFPNLRILILVASLPPTDIPTRNAKITGRWQTAWKNLAESTPKPAAHPHVTAFKTALKGAGIKVSSYPPAIEALAKRVKGPTPAFSVNPFVDFYNSICLTHVLPSGAFDLDEIAQAGHDHDIVLRKSKEGDTFQALDDTEGKPLPEGEIGYFADTVGLSRHFIWRQSKQVSNFVLLLAVVVRCSNDPCSSGTAPRNIDKLCRRSRIRRRNLRGCCRRNGIQPRRRIPGRFRVRGQDQEGADGGRARDRVAVM